MTRLGNRPLTIATLIFALALGASACDKSGETSSDPGEGGSTQSLAKAGTGEAYTYPSEGFTLTSTVKIKFEISSNQGQGAAELSARSLVEGTPHNGAIKIHGQVIELIDYRGSGSMEPEFMKRQAEENGGKAIDIVESLRTAESWMVMDLKGDSDDDATEALAENQNSDDDDTDFGLFALPDLPPVDLEIGQKVVLPTRDDERQLPFGAVPLEIDETWVLRAIDESDGRRIAELDVTIEGSGATTIQGGQGDATVSMFEEAAFTIYYDLDARLPLSLTGYSANETAIDAGPESITFAVNNEIEATYVAGAPEAPADDAPADDAPPS